jgi:hypothetical protein
VQDSLRDIGELDRERLETGTDEAVAALAARLEQFRQAQEEIRSRAVSQVAQLNDEYEQARLEDQQRWQAQIELLESRLFALLCDHGATLALVPGNERLTIRLTGLGDNRDGRRPGDKLHVIEMSELAGCRLGEFDADALRGRAISYSY